MQNTLDLVELEGSVQTQTGNSGQGGWNILHGAETPLAGTRDSGPSVYDN